MEKMSNWPDDELSHYLMWVTALILVGALDKQNWKWIFDDWMCGGGRHDI
jgi:hypothetical protein